MNKERRKRIEEARALVDAAFEKLEQARSLVEDIQTEEQDAFDAMPESFQDGERGQKSQGALDALGNAFDEIDGLDFQVIYDSLDEAGA